MQTLGDHDHSTSLNTWSYTSFANTAPTDPSVFISQCLTLAKLERIPEAINTCETAVVMKPDYKCQTLLAYLYEQTIQLKKHAYNCNIF